MTYSEEQQQAYFELQWKMGEFIKLKKIIKTKKCAIHQRKLKVTDSWEEQHSLFVYISGYCCKPFAIEVRDLLVENRIFDDVIIEPQDQLKQ